MNVSELYFFKTFQCSKMTEHNQETCYYYHNKEDQRRKLISFDEYIKNYENTPLRSNSLLGFNTSENKLAYYKEVMSFDPNEEKLDQMILGIITPCQNKLEYAYHIYNYKRAACPYDELSIACPLGKLCHYEHSDDIEDTNQSMSILKSFITSLVTKHIFIFLRDIVRAYRGILQEPNAYLPESLYTSLLTKLEPFNIFFHEELRYDKIHIEEEAEISKAIVQELDIHKKFRIGANFYQQFDLRNKLVFASLTLPKTSDIIKVVIAMLNSHDGYIIYGVSVNTEEIKSIPMSRKEKDKFRCWFNSEFESILIAFEENIKYNFYESESIYTCVLLISVKQVKKERLISDIDEHSFIIKDKFLQKFNNKTVTSLDLNDIKELNKKEYIEVLRLRLIDHYTKKIQY